MATHVQPSNGSDRVSFFCCESCKDKDIVEYAVCYCAKCQTCFCRKCCGLHDQLFSKHVKYDRGNMRNWSLSKDLEAVLRMCETHTNKKYERFCNDCCMLCCSECASLSHRYCKKLQTLDSAKKHAPDVNQLSGKLRSNLKKLKKLQNCCETSIQDLKSSCKEQEHLVRKMHKKINSTVDTHLKTLKKTAKDEHTMLKQFHESMHCTLFDIKKTTLDETKMTIFSLQASLKTSVEICIRYQNEFKSLNELLLYSSDKNMEKLCFIAGRKCIDKIQQVESYLEENYVKLECLVLNQTIKDTEQYICKLSGLGKLVEKDKAYNDIEQYLSTLSGLWQIVCSNYVYTVSGKSEHKLRIPSDSEKCKISAICVLPGGEILVLDTVNTNVKLLDQQYQVVSHYGVATGSNDICLITPSEVALTVDNGNTHEVQFVTVTPRQFVTGKKIQLQHTCSGIAHHQRDLFITSYTALEKFSLSGKRISKLYEDKSGDRTVSKCAVSPTGDKLYIINRNQHKLLTLARDGTVLATFRDSDLEYPGALHVTSAGQVLVCYESWPSPIIQVHSEGSRKLATLGTQRFEGTVSLCYNSTSSSIIVGRYNIILVFKVQ